MTPEYLKADDLVGAIVNAEDVSPTTDVEGLKLTYSDGRIVYIISSEWLRIENEAQYMLTSPGSPDCPR